MTRSRLFILLCLAASTVAAANDEPKAPDGMVLVPGGSFLMGGEDGQPHEMPVHEVRVDPFYMDEREVTNAQFAEFVSATGYVTEAERWGWSLVFLPHIEGGERVAGAEWWLRVDGAGWRHPQGPDSSIEGKDDYPVVQVSWNDAQAYCEWAGKRLPTEAEWEYAARGGLKQRSFAWGDRFLPEGKAMANTWQGNFPSRNSGEDGHVSLASIGFYPPNAFGLYDIAGNVWEWCADWYSPMYYRESRNDNPQGPASAAEKVLRGGSWLCASSYCEGYRVAHRNKSAPDTGLTTVGFRCVRTVSSDANSVGGTLE